MPDVFSFLEAICDAEGIILFDATSDKFPGVALKTNDGRGIALSPALKGWMKIAVTAHEIGHHVLGHLDDGALSLGKIGDAEAQELRAHREQEACVFAAAFTAVALFSYYAA